MNAYAYLVQVVPSKTENAIPIPKRQCENDYYYLGGKTVTSKGWLATNKCRSITILLLLKVQQPSFAAYGTGYLLAKVYGGNGSSGTATLLKASKLAWEQQVNSYHGQPKVLGQNWKRQGEWQFSFRWYWNEKPVPRYRRTFSGKGSVITAAKRLPAVKGNAPLPVWRTRYQCWPVQPSLHIT